MLCFNRTLPHLTAVVLSAFTALSAAAHGDHTHWGYTGHDSPESWGNLSEEFRLCSTGKNQSPVNITETVSGRLPSIKANYRPSVVEVENNGHTIQVNYPEGGNTLTVNGRTYTLKQFHFHGAGAVIGFDGRQAAGNGFGNVDRGLVFAGGAQAELFGQIAPAFGGIVPCVSPMGVVAMCGGRERGKRRQHDGGQAR